MANTPADILKKTKVTDKKVDKDDNKDDKKAPQRNSLLDFIAAAKKSSKKD